MQQGVHIHTFLYHGRLVSGHLLKPVTVSRTKQHPPRFEILDFLLSLLPLHGSEMVLRQRLLKLGLGTGSFQLKTSSPELQSALELGMKDGWAEYEEEG